MFFDILHVVLSSMSRTATNSEIQNVSLAYETQKKTTTKAKENRLKLLEADIKT